MNGVRSVPAVLATAIVPRGSALLMVASVGLAVAGSIAIARVEAALWKRRRGSRDILFADLMLWGWLRRFWTERRLAQARALYEAARQSGPAVSAELLASLSALLEARDRAYTYGHGQRVARHAERIARAMGLPPGEIGKIRTAAAVHDVGKLYTPREILNNPGSLTDTEFTVMKGHAAKGGDMMAAVGDLEVADMVRHHHERVDGRGYPDGLVGADIPFGARIIAVADTFDAITSNRAYRAAGTQKKALDVLSQEAGAQLDGVAVAAFLQVYSARRSVAWWGFAGAASQRMLAALQSTSASMGAGFGGATSILPTLGAAALLTVSPGLHGPAPIDRAPASAPTRSGQLIIPAKYCRKCPATGSRAEEKLADRSAQPSTWSRERPWRSKHASASEPAGNQAERRCGDRSRHKHERTCHRRTVAAIGNDPTGVHDTHASCDCAPGRRGSSASRAT